MKLLIALRCLILLAPLVFWTNQAFAQVDPHLIPTEQTGECNFMTGEFSYDCIPLYVAYMVRTVFSFLGTLCLIQIIYGGYEVAMGDLTGQTEEGWKRIRHAIIGLAAALFSFAIVDMILAVVV
jgi:hypothetical protein